MGAQSIAADGAAVSNAALAASAEGTLASASVALSCSRLSSNSDCTVAGIAVDPRASSALLW